MGFKVTLKTSRSCVSDYNFKLYRKKLQKQTLPTKLLWSRGGDQGSTRS